jgi:hypothetical protein
MASDLIVLVVDTPNASPFLDGVRHQRVSTGFDSQWSTKIISIAAQNQNELVTQYLVGASRQWSFLSLGLEYMVDHKRSSTTRAARSSGNVVYGSG